MNRALSWLTPLLLSGAVATGCIDEGAAPAPGADSAVPSGSYARITGEGGQPLVVDDGFVVAELRVGHVEALRTVGLKVRVTGAELVEWTRDDAFLTSAGGQVLALESRADGAELSLVVGTTRPVSTAEEARLATLTLRPTADALSVEVVAEGDHLGLVQDGGRRLELTPVSATLEQVRR